MTQQTLADAVGCHVTMIRRYEAGETQPTLEVIRNMARALSVSADALVFEQVSAAPARSCCCSSRRSASCRPRSRPW